MVRGHLKSSRLRKVAVRTPGSKTTVQYKQRNISKPKCAACGNELAGIPRGTAREMKNLPKTKKRPERPFGGTLCASCTRRELIAKARA